MKIHIIQQTLQNKGQNPELLSQLPFLIILSTKLIFILIAPDYSQLSKKAPYQTSSWEMEFVYVKEAAFDHMFIIYHQDKAMENSVQDCKTAKM